MDRYQIVSGSMINDYKIENVGRGSVHKSLRGSYSSKQEALTAIQRHEASLVKKEKKVGKTKYSRRAKHV